MGEVYLAEDTELKRKAALKFLPPQYTCEPDSKLRFKQEAQAAAILNHPNIITVYEVAEYQNRCFIAMEYIEGESLKELIRQKEIPVSKAIDIGIQICEGLQKAHQAGIVHRDIKSANILITRDGRVKILDFGLAKLKGVSRIAQSGSTEGTVAYMSPEQASGQEVDHRSDIFSFGIVIYELITSQLPFKGEYQAAILYSILNEEPEPLGRYKSGIPDELQRIVDKTLKKPPRNRYQNTADLLADLKELQKIIISDDLIVPFEKRKMLAVLPFQNLGPAELEYFADGITDEITAKLAKISGLGVISRTSAIIYKKSDKTLKQIGQELGVQYVLEGTVRWQLSTGGPSRVRITPQLIRVKDDTHLWAECYDAVLAEVFDLQSDTAGKVTTALGIALLEPERQYLISRPTDNLEAYDCYLRGNDYYQRGWSQKNFQIAVQMYEKAVELDPGFALAYARLSMANAELYWFYYDRTDERLAKAKAAVEKALQVGPALPEAHLALGWYYYHGELDYDRALDQFAVAQKSQPNNSDLLAAIGFVQRRLGKFQQAVTNLKKAFELDPHSNKKALEVGNTYFCMRNYPEAEHHFDRAISLAPDWSLPYVAKANLHLNWGSGTARARKILNEASGKINYTDIAHTLAILDLFDGDYQSALSRLSEPNASGNDLVAYLFTKAQIYDLMNQPQLKRDFYNSARMNLETKVKERPQDARFHSELGLAYAGLGEKEKAIMEGQKAVELLPVSKDAYVGPVAVANLARIYVMVGEYDNAIDQLENLLFMPSDISIPVLRLDPTWAPLRNHPRFKKLMEGNK